jgi:hypothetical protein
MPGPHKHLKVRAQAKEMGRIFTRNSTHSKSQENVKPIFELLYTCTYSTYPVTYPVTFPVTYQTKKIDGSGTDSLILPTVCSFSKSGLQNPDCVLN